MRLQGYCLLSGERVKPCGGAGCGLSVVTLSTQKISGSPN